MKKNILLILLFLIANALQAQLPWLHVDGNKIKDPKGNVVILRGVSTQSIRPQITSTPSLNQLIDTLTDVDNPASNSPGWYTKVIRFVIEAPVAIDLDTYYTTYLKPSVDYATSKDLYVIIDYHYISDVQPHDADVKQFWDFMAPKFKNYSNVFYELYNEPINQSFTWNNFYPYMQSWIDIVRAHAPHNLILAGSPYWCQQMAGSVTKPFTGGNIVYVAHLYPQHFTSTFNKSQVEQTAAVHPVFMTEWGFRQLATDNLLKGTITGYGQPIMAWADQLGLSWTAWCADNDWEPAMFTADWQLRIGEGDMGGFVKDTLYAKRDKDQPVYAECNPPFLGPDKSICAQTSISIESEVADGGKYFRWYKDGSLLSSETLPTLSATEAGTYTLEVENIASGCVMSDEIQIIPTLFPVDLGPDKAITGPTSLVAGNASDPYTYEWYKNGSLLPDESSYSLIIDDTCTTKYSVTVSYAGCGSVSDEFTILCKRAMWLGHPITIPGKVEAEFVDIQNLPNLAYNDTDPANNGGKLRTDAIDVESTTDAGGGFNVGWINTGEWYQYSIKVTDPGTYTASIRVASPNTTGKLYLRANSRTISTMLTVPNTGGWQTWTTITAENLQLADNDTILTVYIYAGGFNLNYLDFQKSVTAIKSSAVAPQVTLYPNPVTDVLMIEGEKEYTWEIVDILGKAWLQGNEKQADMHMLPSGIYFLKIESSSFKILKK